MIFIALDYNSGDQNVLMNDWYACLHVLSKPLNVWNANLSLLEKKFLPSRLTSLNLCLASQIETVGLTSVCVLNSAPGVYPVWT